jgi:predicted DsbA family dithiol-disulfide isomerase
VVDLLKAEYNVDVEWRPYYLRPDTLPEGMDLPEYILRARASGSEERLRSMAGMYGMEFKSHGEDLQHTPRPRSDRVRK